MIFSELVFCNKGELNREKQDAIPHEHAKRVGENRYKLASYRFVYSSCTQKASKKKNALSAYACAFIRIDSSWFLLAFCQFRNFVEARAYGINHFLRIGVVAIFERGDVDLEAVGKNAVANAVTCEHN